MDSNLSEIVCLLRSIDEKLNLLLGIQPVAGDLGKRADAIIDAMNEEKKRNDMEEDEWH